MSPWLSSKNIHKENDRKCFCKAGNFHKGSYYTSLIKVQTSINYHLVKTWNCRQLPLRLEIRLYFKSTNFSSLTRLYTSTRKLLRTVKRICFVNQDFLVLIALNFAYRSERWKLYKKLSQVLRFCTRQKRQLLHIGPI